MRRPGPDGFGPGEPQGHPTPLERRQDEDRVRPVRPHPVGEVQAEEVQGRAVGLGQGHRRRVPQDLDALGRVQVVQVVRHDEADPLTAQLMAEREHLRSVILCMPTPMALLAGPEHRHELVNDAYKRVSAGGRDVTGLSPAEAFPELAGHGLFELIDRVYRTGKPWIGRETLVRYDREGTGIQDTWFDRRFAPVRDATGAVTAILDFAVDVTEQVRARHALELLLTESRGAQASALEANALLEDQQIELELVNQQLQDNAAELEAQTEELRDALESLAARTREAECPPLDTTTPCRRLCAASSRSGLRRW